MPVLLEPRPEPEEPDPRGRRSMAVDLGPGMATGGLSWARLLLSPTGLLKYLLSTLGLTRTDTPHRADT